MADGMARQAAGRKAGRAALLLDGSDLPRLEALSEPDAGVFVRALLVHLGLWVAGCAAVTLSQGLPLLQLAVGMVMGSQLHALTVLQHDCGHQSAFRRRAVNRWVGCALAAFIVLPFTSFTELHRMHHSHLGEPDRDPDAWFYAAGPRWLHWRECLFVPRFIALSLYRPMPKSVRLRVAGELALNLVLHALIAISLWRVGRLDVLLFAFALPMAALACLFNPLARGAEHAPMAHLPLGDPRRFDLRFNTVTIAHRGWGLAWANITYHVGHHLYPRVPFHRLPQLHVMLAARPVLQTRSLWRFVRPPN